MPIDFYIFSDPRRRRTVGLLAVLTCLLQACAGMMYESDFRSHATDIWDVSLLPVRHIDLQAQAIGGVAFDVTGLVSAVAAQGDRLYITDSGSRRVLEFGMATSEVRTIGTLRDATSPGLLVGDDGRVFVLDPGSREIQVIDPFTGQWDRVSLADGVAMPVDLALVDGTDLAVVDALTGNVALLDVPGGVFREQPLRRPEFPAVTSARAMAFAAGIFLVLDDRADDVAGFDISARPTGLFASEELHGVRALAADTCGRFFVSDVDDGTIFIGIPDMSLPGVRVMVPELSGRDVTDLWTDDVFLYVATREDGVFVYLVDPGCD